MSQLFTLNCIFYLNIIHPSDNSHFCPLKATSFSFLTGQVSLPCNILLHIQLLYSLRSQHKTDCEHGTIDNERV